MSDIYFAARTPEDTAASLLEKAQTFYNVMNRNAYLDKLRQSWRFYHGFFNGDMAYGDSHTISFTGEEGEFTTLNVNHYRNLAIHMLNMVCANRPAMQARAVNTDYKSLSQTYLANGILDYYLRQKNLEYYLKRAVEMAIVMGAGFIKLEWNSTGGEIYDADEDTGTFNYEGELEFSNLSPFDVVVDGTRESWNNDWVLTRSWVNKYNLIAKYPDLADKIAALHTKDQNSYKTALFTNDNTDDVAVYEFFHKETEAMPNGRYLLFLDQDIILFDGPMPYKVIPVFRIVAGEILGTPYGYTPMFDVYPIQEGINSLYSTIMTNQNAFGVQNLFVPRGADINVNTLVGAMNIIEGDSKPEPLQLTATPPEIFQFLNLLITSAETISGINSVTRGNPEASLKSGNALALVQSMALQFISGLQQSYVKLVEDVGTAIIQILKDYAMTPKTVSLVGKNNRALLKSFTGSDIDSISRVVVDVGNALASTTAGRVQMAEQLLQMGLIKDAQEYFQVMNTGNLSNMYEAEMSELLLIKQENEALMNGEEIHAAMLDAHKQHIMEHKAVFGDPDLRNNGPLCEKILNHIQEHINYLRTADPQLLQLIGEQPLQQPGMQPPNGALPPGPMSGQGPQPPTPPGGPHGPPPPHGPGPRPSSRPPVRPPNLPPKVPAHPPTGPIMQAPTGLAKPLEQIQNGMNPSNRLPSMPLPAGNPHLPIDPRQIIPQ